MKRVTQVEELTAPYRLEYPYKRGLGPVLGAFFGGLKAGRLLGVRSADGAVFWTMMVDEVCVATELPSLTVAVT